MSDATLLPLSLDGTGRITLPLVVCRNTGWDSERPLLAVPGAYAGAILALRPARYLLLIEPSVLTQALQETEEALDRELGEIAAHDREEENP